MIDLNFYYDQYEEEEETMNVMKPNNFAKDFEYKEHKKQVKKATKKNRMMRRSKKSQWQPAD